MYLIIKDVVGINYHMFKLNSLIINIEDDISIFARSGYKALMFIEFLIFNLPNEYKTKMIDIVIKRL